MRATSRTASGPGQTFTLRSADLAWNALTENQLLHNSWTKSRGQVTLFTNTAAKTVLLPRSKLGKGITPTPTNPDVRPGNNGTPSITIKWTTNIDDSVIEFGFHYKAGPPAGPWTNREAKGTLEGFTRTGIKGVVRRQTLDDRLKANGFRGSHGSRRDLDFGDDSYQIIEVQKNPGDFGTWQPVVLRLTPQPFLRKNALTPVTPGHSKSFGLPTAIVVPRPSSTNGADKALVVTYFLYIEGNPSTAENNGELIFYHNI